MLQNFRGVFFLEVLGAAGSGTHTHTLLGDLKIGKRESIKATFKNNGQTHKVHAPKFQGRVFFEGCKAPQAAQHTHTHTRPCWGTIELVKINGKSNKHT